MDYQTNKFKLSNILELSNLVGRLWDLDNEIKSRILYYASCFAYTFFMLSKSNYKIIIKDDNKAVSFLLADIFDKRNTGRLFYLFFSFICVFVMLFF